MSDTKEVDAHHDLVDIVTALRATYNEDGVAIYLAAFNYELRHRPIDLCRSGEGRDTVYTVVCSLGDHDEHARPADPPPRPGARREQ